MKRILVLASILIFSCSSDPQNCDILIENGIIYDGTGDKPYKGVVAISNDKIIYVGKNKNFVADKVIDATDKAVSPGFINAGMAASHYKNQKEREKREDMVPLGRLGSSEDVAKVVMFLLSEDSSYVHGENILIDGGVMNSVLANIGRD